jgi:hypothetical protein
MRPRSVLQTNLPSRWYPNTHHSPTKLMPAVRRLEYVFLHRDAEAVAIVFGRRDGGFVLAAILDPRFKFLVPGVGADTVCCALVYILRVSR